MRGAELGPRGPSRLQSIHLASLLVDLEWPVKLVVIGSNASSFSAEGPALAWNVWDKRLPGTSPSPPPPTVKRLAFQEPSFSFALSEPKMGGHVRSTPV